jgi:hypothetical protein
MKQAFAINGNLQLVARIAVVCVSVMISAAIATSGHPIPRSCNPTSEELAVYTAYLRNEIPAKVNKVILPRTRGYDVDDSMWIGWAVDGRAVPLDVQKDFTRRNAVSCPIHPFSGPPNLHFYLTDKEEGITSRTQAQFERRFGKDAELVEFSRVAFNSNKTVALLHVLGLRTGELYLLERKDGKWTVKYRYGTMAS